MTIGALLDMAVEAGGGIRIHDTTITELPNTETCMGFWDVCAELGIEEIDLSDCTELKSLPERMDVALLYINGCSALVNMPTHLTVQVLEAQGCGFCTLPALTECTDRIDLTGCANLRITPPRFIVGDSAYMTNCTALKSIPTITFMGGEAGAITELDLEGCAELEHIPDNLTVDVLNLSGCANLEIPKGLTVTTELIVDTDTRSNNTNPIRVSKTAIDGIPEDDLCRFLFEIIDQ